MLNQYTTLLLNQSSTDNPFGNPAYAPVVLPQALRLFHALLFPENASTYHCQFLMYCYLRALEAAGALGKTLEDDPRTTYVLDSISEYFRTNRTKVTGDAAFQMHVYGALTRNEHTSYYFDAFDISQIGTTAKLLIYSKARKLYVNGAHASATPTIACEVTVSAPTGLISTQQPLGDTGLSFRISGDFTHFLDSSKHWSVVAESPFVCNLPKIIRQVESNFPIVENMLAYDGEADKEQLAIYRTYFNPVYRFAALLHCFYAKLKDLWQKNT